MDTVSINEVMDAQLALASERAKAKAGHPHQDLEALKRRATELRERYWAKVLNASEPS